ncbi:MAG: hypothetical protein LBM41_08220 [Ruminococcus sp.]|jgi:hypothetical protein|nr:hypothetical protein [Ruminococcus sp.]
MLLSINETAILSEYYSRAAIKYPEAVKWLSDNKICVEKDFYICFIDIISKYTKISGKCSIYKKIGITRCDVSKWKTDFCSSKNKKKRYAVNHMKRLFGISEEEELALLEKAGLALFPEDFDCRGTLSRKKVSNGLSEQMYRHIKKGNYITKRSLIPIVLCEKMSVTETQNFLGSFGYCLSTSLLDDAVILCEIAKGEFNIYVINELLYDLNLPLTGTRYYNC